MSVLSGGDVPVSGAPSPVPQCCLVPLGARGGDGPHGASGQRAASSRRARATRAAWVSVNRPRGLPQASVSDTHEGALHRPWQPPSPPPPQGGPAPPPTSTAWPPERARAGSRPRARRRAVRTGGLREGPFPDRAPRRSAMPPETVTPAHGPRAHARCSGPRSWPSARGPQHGRVRGSSQDLPPVVPAPLPRAPT